MFFGRNLSSFFKKKYPRLPLASGHHELLGQFFWNSKTYGLRKGTRFFILNEHMYFMDDIRLKYVQISLPVRNALFRVFRQEKLSTEDVRLLEETNFFYSL
jgi:hypothetical protein